MPCLCPLVDCRAAADWSVDASLELPLCVVGKALNVEFPAVLWTGYLQPDHESRDHHEAL